MKRRRRYDTGGQVDEATANDIRAAEMAERIPRTSKSKAPPVVKNAPNDEAANEKRAAQQAADSGYKLYKRGGSVKGESKMKHEHHSKHHGHHPKHHEPKHHPEHMTAHVHHHKHGGHVESHMPHHEHIRKHFHGK